MKLNLYIATSILSHFLLLGILLSVHPASVRNMKPYIFDVNIAGPIEISSRGQGSENTKIKGVKEPREQSSREASGVKRKAKNAERQTPNLALVPNTLPKILQGEGTGQQEAESPNGLNSPTGTALPDKNAGLSSGQNGAPLNPKSFLFDKETIEKFAKKTPQEKELTFTAPEFEHRGYMRLLKEKIEGVWKYPLEAARQGIAGDLHIKFIIKKDGSLGDVELMRTSGRKDLDEAAMKAIKDAAPYWPLPDDWDKDVLEITGHFIYLVGGGYVM